MGKLAIKAGSTAQDVNIIAQDSTLTNGGGLTGLAYNSAGLTAYYHRQGASSAVAITLATKTVGTWASGGFVAVDGANMPGLYELGIPDAALAAGARWVIIMLKGAANLAPITFEIELTATDNQDGVAGGMSRLDVAVGSRMATFAYTAPDNAGIGAIATSLTTVLNRLGAFTGSGLNTVLGFLRAIARKDAALTPSDMAGTYDNTTDSLEAQKDASAAASDPLLSAVPGSYAAGTAGAALGNIPAIKAKTDLISTGTAISLLSPIVGTAINVYRGTLWNVPISGLGSLSARTKLYFTVKRGVNDADSAAVLQLMVTNPADGVHDGLVYLNGAAGTLADGSITVDDATLGNITIKVKASSTALLAAVNSLGWDVKMVTNTTTGPVELTRGTLNVVAGETAAIT